MTRSTQARPNAGKPIASLYVACVLCCMYVGPLDSPITDCSLALRIRMIQPSNRYYRTTKPLCCDFEK
ncbi:hypothetical protein CC2G_010125 [Coprinopsis cinerea AmutBmut pab1-1]|nr:hypothetical protein CC2G_010125 [Coprinopsis cinerea AmutBmut pab1-1]